MELRKHDKLKETLKSDSNWEDYYKEIKPVLGLRELGFTRAAWMTRVGKKRRLSWLRAS